ncbi:MAG: AMP-binding protein [Desulfomonilia bacterium]|jgi:phenylacetate-CoA ligase
MKHDIDELETLTYEQSYNGIDRALLIQQLKYVAENSLFYLEKYEEHRLEKNDIIDVNNFELVPFTYKEELLREQEKYPPFGRLATKDNQHHLRRVHMTSGSTGRPLYVVLTENDLFATVEAGRRAFLCAGLNDEDTVIHCLNYCLWAGGLTDHLSLEATGATVIPYGVGNTKQLLRTIINLRPTAISCTPSYLTRLEYILREEFQLSPAALGLEKAFLGGEGGLQNPLVRSRIEETWKMKAIDANYGMADVLSIFGAECEARTGLHFHGQGILYLELIDPSSNKNLPVVDGVVAEMVLTNLRREAQPLVRYRTRDLIQIVSTSQCTCGRKSFRFLVMGRTDDMITVRGINVYPNAIANILVKHPEWFSGEYELIVDTPPPIEMPLLRVELSASIESINNESLSYYLIKKCHENLNFRPRIEFMAHGHFPRTEGKTKRLRKIY